ncbi:hypothetical protein JNB11_06095 [Kocuria palustris]|nr:hypothetical protein [Kocuria palustris]
MASTSSPASLTSLFVPVESQAAIQVINESKEFNPRILEYVDKVTPAAVGSDYHIISVFGSQLTGKSTLLNRLFHTDFDTMDDSQGRAQTTKGIWMAYSPAITSTNAKLKNNDHIFVMDVEGTDGRERGEDQDFERKAALFALSTSEILIVNIWEHQVGLYQGANMGLLKTVFQVNLLLFGKAKLSQDANKDHRVLLLFVIRDFIGNTPLEITAGQLRVDLIKMWDTMDKPAELAHLRFDDFFDLDFHAIHHKILQPEDFKHDIALLGDRLTAPKSLFKPQYHHNIPIDGWTMYAENCWKQIDSNKDLDLPTQQILVAKFKCDEIATSVFNNFAKKFEAVVTENPPSADTDLENLGRYMQDLKEEVLQEYDEDALRYNPTEYKLRRDLLEEELHYKFQSVFDAHVTYACRALLEKYAALLKSLKGKDFANQLQLHNEQLDRQFAELASHLLLGGALEVAHLKAQLQEEAEVIFKKQQAHELTTLVNKGAKRLGNAISKYMEVELFEAAHGEEDDNAWELIETEFKKLQKVFLEKYQKGDKIDFGLATSDAQNAEAVERFKFKAWDAWYQATHKLITRESVLAVLKDRFEGQFRYDEHGKPRLYQNTSQLEISFDRSKAYALAVLPLVCVACRSDGSEITPLVDIFDPRVRAKYAHDSLVDEEDLDSENETSFAQILDDKDQDIVIKKFKKEIDAQFIETKRLIIQHITQIPYYIYIIILLLGWNEFMAVLRNPLLFSLLLIFGGAVYALYTMNMLTPAISVAQRLSDEAIQIGKEKLRELLIDDSMTQGRQIRKAGGAAARETRAEVVVNDSDEGEAIEMQEL